MRDKRYYLCYVLQAPGLKQHMLGDSRAQTPDRGTHQQQEHAPVCFIHAPAPALLPFTFTVHSQHNSGSCHTMQPPLPAAAAAAAVTAPAAAAASSFVWVCGCAGARSTRRTKLVCTIGPSSCSYEVRAKTAVGNAGDCCRSSALQLQLCVLLSVQQLNALGEQAAADSSTHSLCLAPAQPQFSQQDQKCHAGMPACRGPFPTRGGALHLQYCSVATVHALHMPLHLRAGPVHACRQRHEHCPPQHDAWQPCMAQSGGAAHPPPQQREGVSVCCECVGVGVSVWVWRNMHVGGVIAAGRQREG